MPGPVTVDHLQAEDLAAIGFREPARALRAIADLAGRGVTDDDVDELLPRLLDGLTRCPDPDRALTNFARWSESVTGRFTQFRYLQNHPTALSIFLNISSISQFFSDILARNPEYFEILANPGVRSGRKTRADLYSEISAYVDGISLTDVKLEAARQFRLREVLRIGTRDLLGIESMPGTAREFSYLASVCVQKCLEIAEQSVSQKWGTEDSVSIAVIGMGKLGGIELNYSSDIDLLFVMGEPSGDTDRATVRATRVAEALVSNLSRQMQGGHLFRVDMRLRPEGKFGALVRTLSSYATYYENWAEPWEFQALIKARQVAGDTALGTSFLQMVTPFAYRRHLPSQFVDFIRRNKERMERKVLLEGRSGTNVKLGRGGIRDIEFAVQMLQLRTGGLQPIVRSPNTLSAIGRLRQEGLLDGDTADELADDYVFLRTVEHRLQLLYERQTQELPTDPVERHLFARRLGYADAVEFDDDYARRSGRVRGHFERLFLSEQPRQEDDQLAMALDSLELPGARRHITELLVHGGFRDPERAVRTFEAAILGSDYGLPDPRSRESMLQLAPRLVSACARTGDPDSAWQGIDLMASTAPNRAEFERALSEGPELLDLLARLAAVCPAVVTTLSRRQEWLDMLMAEEMCDPTARSLGIHTADLRMRLRGVGSNDEEFLDRLALYIKRERVRIAARDVWGQIDVSVLALELTTLADVALSAILDYARTSLEQRFGDAHGLQALRGAAMLGLGKLGGSELGYGSDLDVLFVYEDGSYEAANALAEMVLGLASGLPRRGVSMVLDPRLRPEGRFGSLVRTVEDYCRYYGQEAMTWERQAMLKVRAVGGCRETADHAVAELSTVPYRANCDASTIAEIRHMKRRIESERLRPDEKHSDIKLGNGGLSDIEFTAQLWQMRHGGAVPSVRRRSTIQALHALDTAGLLPAPEVDQLVEVYAYLTMVRNRITLYADRPVDTLPLDTRSRRSLAVGMGAADRPGIRAEERLVATIQTRMQDARRIVERRFYED